MNKNTLTAILMGLVICLGIVVIVLSIKLSIRPKADSKSDIGTSGTNVVTGEPTPSVTPTPTPSPTPEPEVQTVTVQMVRTTATVNVRPDSSTEKPAIGTATIGSEFVMLEELDNGWTKIEYGDSIAYISSKYLEKFEKQVEATPTPQ